MQLADWLLVEVALLLIGLTHISFVKNWICPSRKIQLCVHENHEISIIALTIVHSKNNAVT
jgi:hypothetical protein